MPVTGKIQPLKLGAADREIYIPAANDLTLWTRYYFDGWTPLDYQHRYYHAKQKKKILVAGIRTGKTMGIAAGFCHYMFYHKKCRIANASISADQANIVFQAMLDFCERPRLAKFVEHTERHPYPLIRFVNGAECWFRSVGYEAELWRGWEFDWINIDEAAYVSNAIAITTLEGRLLGSYNVDGVDRQRAGLFTMTTSPRGKTWLYDRWKRGDPDFYGSQPDRFLSMRARTRDNIHLSEEAIAELEDAMTERQRQQELEGLFVDSEGAQFGYEDIMRSCTPTIYNSLGEIVEAHPHVDDLSERVKEFLKDHAARSRREDIDYFELEPERGHNYVQSWDLGKRPNKLGRNASVGCVFDITKTPWKMVGYRYAPGASWSMSQEYIKEWHHYYGRGEGACETILDASGAGDVVNEHLTETERIPVEGLVYTTGSKPQVIQSLALALENSWFVMPFIRRAVDQLQAYELPDDKIPQDVVMSLGQACLVGRRHHGYIREHKKNVPVIATSRQERDAPQMSRYNQRRAANRGARTQRARTRVGRIAGRELSYPDDEE